MSNRGAFDAFNGVIEAPKTYDGDAKGIPTESTGS